MKSLKKWPLAALLLAGTALNAQNPLPEAGKDTLMCNGSSVQLNAACSPGQATFIRQSSGSVNIPDGNTSGATFAILINSFPAGTMASSVIRSVKININHQNDPDLNIVLIAPNGSVIDLSSGNGGTLGANYTNTVFSESAATSITAGSAPFTGTYRPEQPFSSLTGSANGMWKVRATDTRVLFTGTFLNCSLEFTNMIASYSWSPAGGLNAVNIANPVASPTQSTTYTLVVTDANGLSGSDKVAIDIKNTPVITMQPANKSVYYGQDATLSVTAAGNGLTYSWRVSRNGPWTILPESDQFINTASSTLTIKRPTSCQNFDLYQCVASNGCGTPALSDAAYVSVGGYLPIGGLYPATACAGQGAGFEARVSEKCIYFQWLVDKMDGRGPMPLEGGPSLMKTGEMRTGMNYFVSSHQVDFGNGPEWMISLFLPNVTLAMNGYRYYIMVMGAPFLPYNGALLTVNNCSRLAGESVEKDGAYPNPFTDRLNLKINIAKDGVYRLMVIDLPGREVFSATRHMSEGENTLDLQLPEISKGMYQLVVEGPEGVRVYKITRE